MSFPLGVRPRAISQSTRLQALSLLGALFAEPGEPSAYAQHVTGISSDGPNQEIRYRKELLELWNTCLEREIQMGSPVQLSANPAKGDKPNT